MILFWRVNGLIDEECVREADEEFNSWPEWKRNCRMYTRPAMTMNSLRGSGESAEGKERRVLNPTPMHEH